MDTLRNFLFGAPKPAPKKGPKIRNGLANVKDIAECCKTTKTPYPIGDLISIYRIIWFHRDKGPFGNIEIDLERSTPRNPVIFLTTTNWKESFGHIISYDVSGALGEMGFGHPSSQRAILDQLALRISETKITNKPNPPVARLTLSLPKESHLELFTECDDPDLEIYRCSGPSAPYTFRVGMSGRADDASYHLAMIFATRALSDPNVVRVSVLTLKEHLARPVIYPRVVLDLTHRAPLPQFIESLHLLLEESEFKEVLDAQTCANQPDSWCSVGMAKAYPAGLGVSASVGECIFTISGPEAEDLNWGPMGAFGSTHHPLVWWPNSADGSQRGSDSSENYRKGEHLGELLVATKQDIENVKGYVIDYGWVPRSTDLERLVLHPAYMEQKIREAAEAGIVIAGGDGGDGGGTGPKAVVLSVDTIDPKFVVVKTKDFTVYENRLFRFGFIKGSILEVSYV